MRDFTAIAAIDAELAQLANGAAELEATNALAAALVVGAVAEQLIQRIGLREGHSKDEGESINDYLNRLRRDRIIPRAIISDFHDIRDVRNDASHKINASEAAVMLDRFSSIATWISRTYGASARPGVAPSNPNSTKTRSTTYEQKSAESQPLQATAKRPEARSSPVAPVRKSDPTDWPRIFGLMFKIFVVVPLIVTIGWLAITERLALVVGAILVIILAWLGNIVFGTTEAPHQGSQAAPVQVASFEPNAMVRHKLVTIPRTDARCDPFVDDGLVHSCTVETSAFIMRRSGTSTRLSLCWAPGPDKFTAVNMINGSGEIEPYVANSDRIQGYQFSPAGTVRLTYWVIGGRLRAEDCDTSYRSLVLGL